MNVVVSRIRRPRYLKYYVWLNREMESSHSPVSEYFGEKKKHWKKEKIFQVYDVRPVYVTCKTGKRMPTWKFAQTIKEPP